MVAWFAGWNLENQFGAGKNGAAKLLHNSRRLCTVMTVDHSSRTCVRAPRWPGVAWSFGRAPCSVSGLPDEEKRVPAGLMETLHQSKGSPAPA